MKKILISIVAAMMMLLTVATVSADSLPEVVYNGGPVTMIGNVTHVLMMKTGLEGATDASYSSADPSIVQILEGGVWNSDGVPLCPIIGIKQGSTTITANVKGGFGNRTIQIPITVVPYENPFTSFVICGVDVAPKLAKATTAFYTGIRGKQTITYALKAGWTADVYYGFWQNHNYTKISIKSGAITDLTDVRERGNNYIFAILKQESTEETPLLVQFHQRFL